MAECKLTERISIKKLSGREKDDDGNLKNEYQDYYSCWAAYKQLSGKAFAERQGTNYERVDSFVIRYCNKSKELLCSDLENYKLIHKGRTYSIEYTYDIKNQHLFIDLECKIVE